MAALSLLAGPGASSGVASDAVAIRQPAAAALDVAALKPPIVWKPIPYGDTRKAQMAGYSKRHYGVRTWRLRDPQLIVEHYTTGTTWQGAWNTFAANTKHNGEYPGTCTQFIVDRDGTIYQLVRLHVRCRQAIGTNHAAIGIEHVGTSDRMVLDNRRQMKASLRLTAWLMARYGINVGDVIGHAETPHTPHYVELYPDWRCKTHADFPRGAMKEYRTRLREKLAMWGVPHGPGPAWADNGC